jgi:molybdopterin-containing oxidoreductase family iron-sulfur binding subunit
MEEDFKKSAGRRRYYRSLGELHEESAAAGDEFPFGTSARMEFPADAISRRRFLSLVSASAALAVGTGSCSRIDRGKIVPYTKRPEETIPGVAAYYASTFQEGVLTQGVLVKTREGRPIHVEGNPEHPISRGKASLRAVADVLGLYDPDRLRNPLAYGKAATWEQADQAIARILKDARTANRPVLLITDAVISPTRRALIQDLKRALPDLVHASWEPAAPQAEILAARALYGEAVMPRLRLDLAQVVLSLDADFLGADAVPSYVQDFAAQRKVALPGGVMNRLWVAEGGMSLTGANADQRLQVRPSEIAPLAFALAGFLNALFAVPLPKGFTAEMLRPFDLDSVAQKLRIEPSVLRALAGDLQRAGKSALVLAGAALPREAHIATQLINVMLGAEGTTIDASLAPPVPELLTASAMRDLLAETTGARFAAVIFWNTNPYYWFQNASTWRADSTDQPARIRIGLYEDETAVKCRWQLPEHHWLESWDDFEPAANLLSLRQPTLGALHNTRQGGDILLSWMRMLGAQVPASYHEYLKQRWQKEVFPAGSPAPFETFWNAALHDGLVARAANPKVPRLPRAEAIAAAAQKAASASSAGDLELVLLPDTAVYDGRYANNGWLNELPNPVTKATWGNPVLVSIADAERLGIQDGDVVRLSSGGTVVDAAAVVQPGQTPGVASIALGYGRMTGTVAAGVGVNACPLLDHASTSPNLRPAVRIAPAGIRRAVPRTQDHFRMEGRDQVRSWTMVEYTAKAKQEKHEHEHGSLIPAPQFTEHKWGMVIDLSACVGCSACLIACQSENNVPVVGPDRVERGRVMHWIRIDRYYEGDPKDPSVVHQPVLCQHCDRAPCEIVCPVNATTHSTDGLNQMSYNRCVGTRYCSNNCPYKVRRFNFFDYTSMKKAPENLIFNPEVTVRPRGVMEKCTFCIQRIEDARLRAKAEGRPLQDGEIRPACVVACPANAIVFGDLNDPGSRVAGLSKANRGYKLLAELGVSPSITYLADISNPVTGKRKA